MRVRTAPARVAAVIYEGVEPIDLGATIGVLSMARRILPNLTYAVIAATAGPVLLAGGLVVEADYGVAEAPAMDLVIVCGGPGWRTASENDPLRDYLRALRPEQVASVCTGAMILASAGILDGRTATTRRAKVGAETAAPLDLMAGTIRDGHVQAAAVVDDTVVTGGGVSLAIDATLYLLGRLYDPAVTDDVARIIEYDRAYAANHAALGVVVASHDRRETIVLT